MCRTWPDVKKKERGRTVATSVRFMRPAAAVTRRHQTIEMLGEDVQMDPGFAGSDK